MSTLRVARTPCPDPAPITPLRRVLSAAAADVDHLFELRGLIKRAQAEERRLTQAILGTCETRGLQALVGTCAVATVEPRTTLRVDPELFLEAAGPRAPEALTVNLTVARTLLGEDLLAAIGETTTTRALRVDARVPAPRVA
jgi:hypothetical protein